MSPWVHTDDDWGIDTYRGDNDCPWCGVHHDAASGIRHSDEKRGPSEGDCSICWSCGRIATFGDDGKRRFPHQDELDRFLADDGVRIALATWSMLNGGRLGPPPGGTLEPLPRL